MTTVAAYIGAALAGIAGRCPVEPALPGPVGGYEVPDVRDYGAARVTFLRYSTA